MKRIAIVTGVLLGISVSAMLAHTETYEPNWESLDRRQNPQWFGDAKFGIFIHWGLYSVPSYGRKGSYAEWYWSGLENPQSHTRKFHTDTYGDDFQYQDFADDFKAELFDPAEWADIFARAGARYVVLTSKHHEGFCLWPSAESWNWNSVDCGPHRDLCGDLIEAVRARGIKMGFYYSLYEWFNPLYKSDVNAYIDQRMLPQLKDLVTRYQPDIVWGDGEWDHPSETWRSEEFLAWLYNDAPNKNEVVVNDRWGGDTRFRHGGFYSTEYDPERAEELLHGGHDWEECRGIGASFGYNRNENIDNYRSVKELLHILINMVSHGGNLLLDIGPTADGRIPVIMQQRLLGMGEWLEVNGEAIYETRPWRFAVDGETVRYTSRGDTVYAISLQWPGEALTLENARAQKGSTITLLGYDEPLKWEQSAKGLVIHMPERINPDEIASEAYTFRLQSQPAVADPAISPSGGVFSDDTPVFNVTLHTETEGAEIRYTLDGSDPTSKSKRYRGGMKVDKEQVVRARAFKRNMLDSREVSAAFQMPLEPVAAVTTKSGVTYRYFEDDSGERANASDFDHLDPSKDGISEAFSIAERRRDENVAFQFRGLIEIPSDGLYTFYTESDDGSALSINDRLVVDNDGPHGMQEKSGSVPLRKGKYGIKVTYQQGTGSLGLKVSYEGPGIAKQAVPAGVLSHEE